MENLARYLWINTFNERGQNNQELFESEYDCYKTNQENYVRLEKNKLIQLELF